jgi:acetyltransferase
VTPDLAVICGPAAAVAEALDQAGRKGTKTAVVTTVDPDGPDVESALKRSLRQAGKRHGCRFLGPASAGINMPVISLNASWTSGGLAAGKLALVSQSASVASSVVEWAISRGIGLSRVISMGDEADIGVDEVLRQLAADPRTTGILLYLRSPSHGRAFVSAARAAGRIKPILVLKPREPSLSGDCEPYVDPDDIYDAIFHRAGLLRVDDAAEWFDAAESLSPARQLRVGPVAIVSNGSGPARLAAAPLAAERLLADLREETIARLKIVLPGAVSVGNPLILRRDATANDFTKALAALRGDPSLAATLVVHSPAPSAPPGVVAPAIARAAHGGGMHIAACWFGSEFDRDVRASLTGANLVLHNTPEKAARAVVLLDRYRRGQEALRQIPISRRQELVKIAESASGAATPAHALLTTDEKESTAFLAAYGKIWRAIKANRATLNDDEGMLVLSSYGFRVRQIFEGELTPLPLSFGIGDDPIFGRVIVVNAAGKRLVVLPPLNWELTKDLARDVQAAVRAACRREVSRDSLRENTIRLADLAVELPEIVGVQLSPIVSDGDGLMFCGAHICVSAPAGLHLSIHPYPRELEKRIRLKDGQDVLVRPMRFDDIALYHKMLNTIPKEELFLRFCGSFGDVLLAIPTETLANLVHLDYSRDVTLIAVRMGSNGNAEALGVVDVFIAPSGERPEYSILVCHDLAGTGLGKALMAEMIGYCRAQKVGQVFGLVLRQNARMLGLCARLGFVKVPDEDDQDMVKVELAL